jgi:hypothetical protein
LDAFWSEISSAQRIANQGVPLLGTFIAIVVASAGLRRQLSHDRELVQAVRRSEAAREFASEALAIIAALEEREPADPWWRRPRFAETQRIYDAQHKAQVLLGESQLIDDIRIWDS